MALLCWAWETSVPRLSSSNEARRLRSGSSQSPTPSADTRNVDEVVETMVRLCPNFGAVNLEDVVAPRCFELEQQLIEALGCPVMHDDQHGTAVVVLAALTNATRLTGRDFGETRVVAGAGAGGIAVTGILLEAGIDDVVLIDSPGTIHRDLLVPGARGSGRSGDGPSYRFCLVQPRAGNHVCCC